MSLSCISVKKMQKKKDERVKLLSCLSKPTAFFPFSLPWSQFKLPVKGSGQNFCRVRTHHLKDLFLTHLFTFFSTTQLANTAVFQSSFFFFLVFQSSVFAARDVWAGNVLSAKERGKKAAFASYLSSKPSFVKLCFLSTD